MSATMVEYYTITAIGDPLECQFPLRRKDCPRGPAPTVPETPPELRFVATSQNLNDLAPLIKVFQKYPEIRNAVVRALRDEGFVTSHG